MKNVILLLLLPTILLAQLVISNKNNQEVMRIDQRGMAGFGTTNLLGRVTIDSLGTIYNFLSYGGSANAQSCLYLDAKHNIDYNNSAVKYPALHVFAAMGASPSMGNVAKQDIAISAQLLNANRTKSVGTANLAFNWVLGPNDPNRRDVAIVSASLNDANEITAANDVRICAAVRGHVESENNTVNPEVVWAGYFDGAPSYFGGKVHVSGSVQIGSTNAYFLGPSDTDGTWRIIRISGNNLAFQVRQSGSWVTRFQITPQ